MNKLELLYDVVDESTRAQLDARGEKSVSLTDVKNFLNANKGQDVEFDIASLGGDLDTGIKIHELIKLHTGKTTARIVGLTASAGTIIALGCDEVSMSNNALWLIHNGWKTVKGNIYDFEQAVKDMSKTDAVMVKIYRENSNLKDEKIIDLMKASDWMTATEAKQYGFINSTFDSDVKIAASIVNEKLNNNLLIKLQEKMKLFAKKEDEQKAYPLALKDGNTLVMAAEEAAKVV